MLRCGGESPEPQVGRAAPSASVSAASAPSGSTSVAPPAPSVGGASIDRTAMDPAIRPGNDFFLYANGAWYRKTEFAADRSSAGVWIRLTEEIEQRTTRLLEDAAAGKGENAAATQKLGDFYASYMDEARIEKLALAPIAPELARIAKISDGKSLAAYLGAELRADVDALNSGDIHTDRLFGLYVDGDLNDPSKNAGYLMQGGLGMPDRGDYLDEGKDAAARRDKYLAHLEALFTLAKIAEPKAKAKAAFALERRIAEVHVSRVDAGNVSTANNPWPRSEFGKRAPGLDWETYFRAAKLDGVAQLIVWMPKAVIGEAALAKSASLADWRAYLTARALDRHSPFLGKAFATEHFAFYEGELAGKKAQPPRTRDAINVLNEVVPELVGREYVRRHFPEGSKKEIEAMVASVTSAFARRIDALAWMSDKTKARAKEKLATLKVGVGYPDKWFDDAGLSVKRDDLYGNVERAIAWDTARRVATIGKPLDRSVWEMPAQVVNAQNLPIRNALSFPAGILVPPFYDPKATAAANYGGLGATIGHEISHSFDDEGAKFDAQGRLVDWWTKDDYGHFEAAGAALAAQFSSYKPYPDLAIDGKLTLGENLADLAGLAAAYDAWKASLNGQPAPMQDGFTGDQQFFLSYAQTWQDKLREPLERTLLKTNGHAPAHWRALTVRNMDAWYAAFDVQPTDALYLAPSARVRIW